MCVLLFVADVVVCFLWLKVVFVDVACVCCCLCLSLLVFGDVCA